MSQFNTLSDSFRESLLGMGDMLQQKSGQGQEGLATVLAFFDGPVSKWYEGLDEQDRAEVDRLFGQLKELGTEPILDMMKAEDSPTPFNLVASLFGSTKKGHADMKVRPGNRRTNDQEVAK